MDTPHPTASLSPAPATIEVLFVLLPNSLALDWAGPAEALRVANATLRKLGQPARFVTRFVGPEASPVTSVGLHVTGVEPLPNLAAPPPVVPPPTTDRTTVDVPACPPPAPVSCTWVVLVGEPGDAVAVETPAAQAALHWLRGLRLQSGRLELVTVCAGAVLAAHAGLLSGREATTHHDHLAELRAADRTCQVQSNRVFVADGPVHSSAGVTTGIDLMLHRIASVCGPVVAARVAQTLVVALRRGPNDPELSPFLSHRNHLQPAIHRVQDAVSQAPRTDWTLARMADVACTSPRHLTRLFMTHAGIAPTQYVRQIRLGVAQTALQSGLSVMQAADLAGFHSDTQLRRAWHQGGYDGRPSDVFLHQRTK